MFRFMGVDTQTGGQKRGEDAFKNGKGGVYGFYFGVWALAGN